MDQPYPRLCVKCGVEEERLFEQALRPETPIDRLKFLMAPLLQYFKMSEENHPYTNSWVEAEKKNSYGNIAEIETILQTLK